MHVGYLRVILLRVQAEDSSVYRLARTMFSRLPDLGPGWMPGAEDAVSAEMTTYFHVTPAGKKRHGCPLETRPARAFLFFQKALLSYTLPLRGLLVLLVGILSTLTHFSRLESTFSGALMHTGCLIFFFFFLFYSAESRLSKSPTLKLIKLRIISMPTETSLNVSQYNDLKAGPQRLALH